MGNSSNVRHCATEICMCRHIYIKIYIYIHTLAKQVRRSCVVCQKVDRKVICLQPEGGREPGIRPFQSVQVDFTELLRPGRFKYLLVLVNHSSGWAEAFSSVSATANVVTKVIPEQIIPRYGIVENTDPDRGSHFMPHILQGLM